MTAFRWFYLRATFLDVEGRRMVSCQGFQLQVQPFPKPYFRHALPFGLDLLSQIALLKDEGTILEAGRVESRPDLHPPRVMFYFLLLGAVLDQHVPIHELLEMERLGSLLEQP